MIAFLCLGSNMGDKAGMLSAARDKISLIPHVKIIQCSEVIITEPYGVTDQPEFLNQVISVETELEPLDLLQKLLDIELTLGRTRIVKWGPRLIDIDILMIDDLVYKDDQLTLPHPDFHRRKFALELLMKLNQDIVHPVFDKKIGQLLDELNNGGTK